MDTRNFIAAGLLALLASCNVSKEEPGNIVSNTKAPQSQDELITRVALAGLSVGETDRLQLIDPEQSGLTFSNVITDPLVILSTYPTVSGIASADYDADGDLDIFIVAVEESSRLFRNDGAMKFTDVTAEMPCDISNSGALGASAVFLDIEADGDLDLYVGYKNRANALFINEDGLYVRDEAGERGIANEHATASASVFDADNDGDLDMYIASHLDFPHNRGILRGLYGTGDRNRDIMIPEEHRDKFYNTKFGDTMMKPDPDQFLLNDGTGHFTDATVAAGLDVISWSMHPHAVDIDNDGWTDIYLTSDLETRDSLFINNRDGTFSERSAELLRKSPYFSMGSDSGDINNDGLPDIFAGDMLSREKARAKRQSGDMKEFRTLLVKEDPQPVMRNMLWLNRGAGRMTEMAEFAGVKAAEWSWSGRFIDLDCDGWEDLIVSNGFIRDAADVDELNTVRRMSAMNMPAEEIERMTLGKPLLLSPNYVFQRTEPGKLEFAVTDDNWGISRETFTPSFCVADLDGDGDLDMLFNNVMGTADLYRNDVDEGNRLKLSLTQDGANPGSWGARVWAHCGDMIISRDLIANRGYATGEPGELVFGLGELDRVDRLEFRWPDGTVQELADVEAGWHYSIHKAQGLPRWQPVVFQAMFSEEQLPWSRDELDTDEYEFSAEPLLPFMQGYSGGGLGLADFNRDGWQDVYLAGVAGQRGKLLLGNAEGGFADSGRLMPDLYPGAEEMSVLCFDANADGYPDMLICAGGNEAEAGSTDYRDRLLINNAGVGFRAVSLGLEENVSTAAADAAEIDGDGDLDLLICGHLAGRQFGVGSRSWILLNDGSGRFTDATDEVCPDLLSPRLITDAALADLDGDGLPEIVASQNWGPLLVFANREGRMGPAEGISGNGWWNSICVADLNDDMVPEIIAANIGQNTKYHPSADRPALMYAGDMDGNGTRDLIEVSYRGNGDLIPGRGRSCSGYAISKVARDFETWESFANASLTDVYGQDIFRSEEFTVTDVGHAVFVRHDNGNYHEHPLPDLAQLAPAYGITVDDFDGDGSKDIFMANNFRWTQPETGRWDMGTGTLLLGDGMLGFRLVEPLDSGIHVHDDCRGVVSNDWDNDGDLDLLVSVSNASPRLLRNNESGGEYRRITVSGPTGNPDGVGSLIRLELSDGRILTRRISARCSYQSSSCGPHTIAIPAGCSVLGISILSPDQTTSDALDLSSALVDLSWN